MQTYEAADYRNAYARAMELAGHNQLFPEYPSFRLPGLENGDRSAGSNSLVPGYIPPVLLKAIGWIESGWAQASYVPLVNYGEVGPTLISHDCGYGIMQVTSGMQNVSGVPTLDQAMIGGHYAFNIARGAQILASKWNQAPEFRPIVGNRDAQVVENWYFALWGYNGFAFKNHPLNPAYDPARPQYSCGPEGDGFGHNRGLYPYQELVLGCAAHPPVIGGQPLWTPVEVHLPDLADPVFAGPLATTNWEPCSYSLVCAPMDIPTPNPSHADPTAPGVTREQALGTPMLQGPQGGISLVAAPSESSPAAAVPITNGGSGVLAWRLTPSISWLRLSQTQGVSLGPDLGSAGITVEAYADASHLWPGVHQAYVTIESLYGTGAPVTVPVSVRVLDFANGTLLRGSSPTVYVMSYGYKRHVVSLENFLARGFSFSDVVQVPDSWLNDIPTAQPLLDALATGNLLRGSGPDVYVMENGFKRHAASASMFLACGYFWDAVRDVPQSLLGAIPLGASLGAGDCPAPAFADGTILQGSGATVWVASSGTRRWAVSPDVFGSCGYLWANINRLADSTVNSMSGGPAISNCAADGTLVRGSTGTVYVMQSSIKRHLVNAENFIARGYSWETVVPVSDSWLNSVASGQPLLEALATGNLVRGSASDVYVMDGGSKRHAVSVEVFLACGYWWDAVRLIPDSLLQTIPTSVPLATNTCPRPAFADETLLQGSGATVWVVLGGLKRWAVSPDVLLGCGYKWGNVNQIADSTIEAIPSGPSLSPC
jgi:hypothetical protein